MLVRGKRLRNWLVSSQALDTSPPDGNTVFNNMEKLNHPRSHLGRHRFPDSSKQMSASLGYLRVHFPMPRLLAPPDCCKNKCPTSAPFSPAICLLFVVENVAQSPKTNAPQCHPLYLMTLSGDPLRTVLRAVLQQKWINQRLPNPQN